MIECPKCGGDTRITETRQALSGARRRRKCLLRGCDGRVTTIEIVVHEADRVPGGMALVSIAKLRKMAAVLADVLQEQVGAKP
jgi:transcriptional regulator NrdR family protein